MDHTTTEIHFAPGDDALAATLAAAVPGATEVLSDDTAKDRAQLVPGPDFSQVGQQVVTAAPAARTDEDARTAADTTCSK